MTSPIPARAPMTAQGAQILRPTESPAIFRTRLDPQILRNTRMQVLRTTPAWVPPAAAGPAATAAPPPAANAVAAPLPADGGPPLGPEEFVPVPGEMTFDQFLQGLNPLHHLPGVGTIYRAVTGAEIHPVMRVLGGAAFGGPVGMILAAIGSVFDATRPLERLGATLAGRPDPHMPAPGSAAAQAAAAYARFGTPG